MSSFEVKLRKISVSEHPNADKLVLGKVDGYRVVMQKGSLEGSHGLGVYIPTDSVLPWSLVEFLGLVDRLAGGTLNEDGTKIRNRVRPVKLRGELSEGLILPLAELRRYLPHNKHLPVMSNNVMLDPDEWPDLADLLHIEKYVAPIPVEMSGQLEHCEGLRSYTDVENIKKFPDAFAEGEPYAAFEKLHGTCTIFCLRQDGEFVVSSKGVASRGQMIVESEGNVYWRAARAFSVEQKLRELRDEFFNTDLGDIDDLYLFGETINTQKGFSYDVEHGDIGFFAFDIMYGGKFLNLDSLDHALDFMEIPMVPSLRYGDPFSWEDLKAITEGDTEMGGRHIREGVVIRTMTEQGSSAHGRMIFKSVNPEYAVSGADTGVQ